MARHSALNMRGAGYIYVGETSIVTPLVESNEACMGANGGRLDATFLARAADLMAGCYMR